MNSKFQQEIDSLKVVESNELVRASYKLSKRALLFALYLVAKLDSINQEKFVDIYLSYSQIVAILNFDGKRRISKRKEVFSIMDELNCAPIFWEDTDDTVQVNWLSSMVHHKKTDMFRLRLDDTLAPYLLRIKSCFTEFFYKYIFPMELSASIRIYSILKSYHSGNRKIEKIFEIDDLKFRLWLKGKYQKFYEFKRRVLSPAMKELESFTDLKASYCVHKKTGKTVTEIKFQILPNKKNKDKPSTPNSFVEAIKNSSKKNKNKNPYLWNEIFQLLNSKGIELQNGVKKIIEKCDNDGEYKAYVKDTVDRCVKNAKGNPEIKNLWGYILNAIKFDYHKDQREAEQLQAKKEAGLKTEKLQKEKIDALVQEWKESFRTWRRPFIKKLRLQYMDESIAKAAIKENAPSDAIYHKSVGNFLDGKKSKIVDGRIDDYLVRKHLEPEFSNVDSYLEKNFWLKKNGSAYQLSE